jgi:hypothetical protein
MTELVYNNAGMIFTGKTKVLGEKTCPIATFSTTNFTWAGPIIEPGSSW